MTSKEFKIIFGKAALINNFSKAFGGWFKESNECICILELQKSNFGDYYQLNIKIFIQGAFGSNYLPTKDLIKSSIGHVTIQVREKDFLDFDHFISDELRMEKLNKIFKDFVVPIVNKALSKDGLRELSNNGQVSLLPAIKFELDK